MAENTQIYIDSCAICYEIKPIYTTYCCQHFFCIRCLASLNKCAMCRIEFYRKHIDELKQREEIKKMMAYNGVNISNKNTGTYIKRFDGMWYYGY